MEQERVSELMLRACLASEHNEVARYAKLWDENIDIDLIDYRGMRLAPYFLDQLNKNTISSKYIKRLKVLHQYWWLKTKFLQDQLKKICNKLGENNIQPLVFKGGNLMFYYIKPVLRPMTDIDIFVPPDKIEKTFKILQSMGYSYPIFIDNFLNKYQNLFSDFQHAATLENNILNTEIDIHWRLGSYLSTVFSQQAYEQRIKHPFIKNAYCLNAKYELLHTILHAVISKEKDNLNWILDMKILKENNCIPEIQEIVTLAEKEKKLSFLYRGINILKDYNIDLKLTNKKNIKNEEPRLCVYNSEVKGIENFFQRMKRKSRNSWITVSLIFPESNLAQKFYQYFRIGIYQFLNLIFINKSYPKKANTKETQII